MVSDQISPKEFGEMSANVRTLLREWQEFKTIYATKAELEPLKTAIQELKNEKHRVWDKAVAIGSIGSLVVGGIALFRTFH